MKWKELFQWVIIIMAVINSVIDFSNPREQIILEVVLKSPTYFKYVVVKKILTLNMKKLTVWSYCWLKLADRRHA